MESLRCGERIVYDGAVNEAKIGPELSSPLRVDSQPGNEDTPFTIHTTTGTLCCLHVAIIII